MALSDSALLDALDRHSTRLEATADGLDDVTAPSLCPGWTRGHVLSHLARNAEAIAGLCRAAVDGEQRAMYPSDEARDADVEAGAGRDAATQAADVRATDRLVAEQLARLRPEHAEVPLERTPGGRLVPAGRLPFMRLREVVLHHLDLDAGFGLTDVEPELTADLLAEEVARLRACDPAPDLTLRTDEGDEWTTRARHRRGDRDADGGARLARPRPHRRAHRRPAAPPPRGTVTTVAYTGDVTPGGPTDTLELGPATIRKMAVSDMHNNVYLLTCTATGEQLMVDAADDPARCLALVEEGTGRLDRLVTTHQHWDHVRALEEVARATGARTYAGEDDADALPLAPDVRLQHGDTVARRRAGPRRRPPARAHARLGGPRLGGPRRDDPPLHR